MVLDILAMASHKCRGSPPLWQTYISTRRWDESHGQQYVGFAPLFGHQFSHVFVDFRGIRDPSTAQHGIDWFDNSRRATLAQRQYAIANPMGWTGYDGYVWGLTASD